MVVLAARMLGTEEHAVQRWASELLSHTATSSALHALRLLQAGSEEESALPREVQPPPPRHPFVVHVDQNHL